MTLGEREWRDEDKVRVIAQVWYEDLMTGTLSSGHISRHIVMSLMSYDRSMH